MMPRIAGHFFDTGKIFFVTLVLEKNTIDIVDIKSKELKRLIISNMNSRFGNFGRATTHHAESFIMFLYISITKF